MKATFPVRFQTYLEVARAARDAGQHHDYRRSIFLDFLHDAFDIDLTAVDIEQFIQIQGQQVPVKGMARVRKGWIDAVFGDVIFEFKKEYGRERPEGLRELHDYLSTIPNGESSVGLLTDGLQFEAFVLDAAEDTRLRQTSEIDLERATPAVAFLWLDAYLFSQKHQPPTAADIVQRFGLRSPSFAAAARVLRQSLAVFSATEAGASEVKRQQWARHLARVYGSADARNDEMFVRHTYLCQFAKILAFAAQATPVLAAQAITDVVAGNAFEVLGVNNIGEQDFFAWVLAPEVAAGTLPALQHIAASLAVYDLRHIDEDLLKQLYQNLVEPETRHELGEFYTPDWLADLTLEQIAYGPGQSLLDPACGSGTFLFMALRQLATAGMAGSALVDFALENVMGMDVHPLAVTIAKVNYLLAILPHLRAGSGRRTSRAIPIFLANALQLVDELATRARQTHVQYVPVAVSEAEQFRIPATTARYPDKLNGVLATMGKIAEQQAQQSGTGAPFGTYALGEMPPDDPAMAEMERLLWNDNVAQLAKQIRERRDTIWIYLLQNTTRPLLLQHRKFDVVAGNPPWLSYRYIQDASYQRDVLQLARDYQLVPGNERKLTTQIELSTIFFAHAASVYLKPTGTLAFVMPRSVLTGAKQHAGFQHLGFSQVIDCKDVAPLFKVETCVLIRRPAERHTADIPTLALAGKLPAHETTLPAARAVLRERTATTSFAQVAAIASPYYHPRFLSGANLYPRNLVFVTSAQPDLKPGALAFSPIMQTDPDVDAEAKAPWKGLRHQGHIDDEFLYATVLSKNIVPFGIRKLHLVALPMVVHDGNFAHISPLAMKDITRPTYRFTKSADGWFDPVEAIWAQTKKEATQITLWQWINYQNKIMSQNATPGFLVAYGASGSNIAATVIDKTQIAPINGTKPQAFLVDCTNFYYQAESEAEAHFLSALLNAPCVDAAIKIHQPRGLFGPRHIQRRPFEVCPIPEFDPRNAEHVQLAELSMAAHAAVAQVDVSAGGVVAARKAARLAAAAQIAAIDGIAQRLLGLVPPPGPLPIPDGEGESDDEGRGDDAGAEM